ncbi:MAG: hypothetical protein PF904_17610 [Kiritimatiellae bacterium]|jgi:phage I-like protein|nr:hypothetical protein [Kiritimatiellia bacterium]
MSIFWNCNEQGIDPKKEYRDWLEDYIKQGVEEKRLTKLTSVLAIGSTAFIEKLHRNLLKEIGGYTGMKVKAVSQGESRIRKPLDEDKLLKEQYLKILKLLGEKIEL